MNDVLLLSRIQFAVNISFHILFPMITIALAWILLFFKLRYNRSRDEKWMNAYRLWVKIFALTFALGVVSGITMSFQFGTNWPGYMETVGNIAGPMLAYEVLTAFFLEATFLGVMLFGFNRVSNRVHTLATLLVAVGTSLSAFWILALVSWMHTPAGFEMRDGMAHATDWLAVIFNPSFGVRFVHTMIASFLTVAFLLAGISAYRLLRGDRTPAVDSVLRVGIVMAAVLAPTQVFVGDLHGLNTLEHQPAKVAAMEALWETRRGAPLVLFALPDEETQSNRFSLEVPRLASLILTHSLDGEVQGIDAFPDSTPPVAPVFWAFRIMVGVGVLMLLVAWATAFRLYREGTPGPRTLRLLAVMSFSGWLAVLAGWYTTEIGRQPYLVTGVLRTADAVTSVPAGSVVLTLAMYIFLYLVLIGAYVSVVFHLAREAGRSEVKSSRPSALGPSALDTTRAVAEQASA
jgi:cytochrome d ubiquinol oxidase subunit I